MNTTSHIGMEGGHFFFRGICFNRRKPLVVVRDADELSDSEEDEEEYGESPLFWRHTVVLQSGVAPSHGFSPVIPGMVCHLKKYLMKVIVTG